MARRSRGGFAALLIALIVAACAGGDTVGSTTPSNPSATLTPTTATTPSTLRPSTTTSTKPVAGAESFEIDAEVSIPDGEGPFPAVVLVHGGGWVAGSPSVMRPLAEHLNESGYLTVNTRYRLSTLELPGFPEAVDDVACAVRYAASHPDSDGTVALIGHSAGAHIGALVALTGDDYVGACPLPGSGVPERFVGLAGPYDISRLGLAMLVFFGESETVNPGVWAVGNPQDLTDENTELDSLIMYGELDGLVADQFAFDFYAALESSGSSALLELVEGARHNDMHDPALVGDLIVAWLDR
ncbi:MAG: alpha/beta hydrolase [Acidimicrobiia bacterium]